GRFGRLPTVPGPPLPAYVVMRSHHDVLVCSVPGRGCACLCGLVPAGGEGPGQGHGRYGDCVLALLLVALSLGLSNFAAAVGIGVSGVDARTRLRVGVIFGLFETGMPIVGLLLGRSLASTLGHAAHWAGAVLLVATGLYAVVQAIRGQ